MINNPCMSYRGRGHLGFTTSRKPLHNNEGISSHCKIRYNDIFDFFAAWRSNGNVANGGKPRGSITAPKPIDLPSMRHGMSTSSSTPESVNSNTSTILPPPPPPLAAPAIGSSGSFTSAWSNNNNNSKTVTVSVETTSSSEGHYFAVNITPAPISVILGDIIDAWVDEEGEMDYSQIPFISTHESDHEHERERENAAEVPPSKEPPKDKNEVESENWRKSERHITIAPKRSPNSSGILKGIAEHLQKSAALAAEDLKRQDEERDRLLEEKKRQLEIRIAAKREQMEKEAMEAWRLDKSQEHPLPSNTQVPPSVEVTFFLRLEHGDPGRRVRVVRPAVSWSANLLKQFAAVTRAQRRARLQATSALWAV